MIEEQFFKTFGIEPVWKDKRVKNEKTHYTEEQAQYLRNTTKNRNIQLCYPEITAERLLELICIISKYQYILEDISAKTINELKKQILDIYIKQKIFEDKETINQVRKVFDWVQECE